jgi:hypothetical protein
VPNRSPLRRWLLPALLLILVPVARAPGQGTTPVPPSDPVYRDVDRLAQLGLLDSAIVGQRPWSRRELARIAGLARERLGTQPDAALRSVEAGAIVARIAERFGDDGADSTAILRLVLLDGASLGAVSTDAERRGFAGSFPRLLEATIDPLAAPRRLGPPVLRGESGALELAQRVELSRWLAIHARERFELALPRPGDSPDAHADLLLGGVRLRARNVALSVGRE